jgi:hypothetical protein
MGACEGVGGSVLNDAFGMVANVAMTPLISIQILGLLYKWKLHVKAKYPATEKKFDNFAIYEYKQEDLISNDE